MTHLKRLKCTHSSNASPLALTTTNSTLTARRANHRVSALLKPEHVQRLLYTLSLLLCRKETTRKTKLGRVGESLHDCEVRQGVSARLKPDVRHRDEARSINSPVKLPNIRSSCSTKLCASARMCKIECEKSTSLHLPYDALPLARITRLVVEEDFSTERTS